MEFYFKVVSLQIIILVITGEASFTKTCFECLDHGKIFVRSL